MHPDRRNYPRTNEQTAGDFSLKKALVDIPISSDPSGDQQKPKLANA